MEGVKIEITGKDRIVVGLTPGQKTFTQKELKELIDNLLFYFFKMG